MSGGPRSKKAQVSLEITVGLICVFILLGACVHIFTWANRRLALRQEKYEMSRVLAGGTPLPIQVQVNENTGDLELSPPPFPANIPISFINEFLLNFSNWLNEILTLKLPIGERFQNLHLFNQGGEK